MFTNKAANGTNNLCGRNIYAFRKNMGISQRELADKLQIQGLDVDKNAVQRIEAGKRFVTDIELSVIATVFKRSLNELIM